MRAAWVLEGCVALEQMSHSCCGGRSPQIRLPLSSAWCCFQRSCRQSWKLELAVIADPSQTPEAGPGS